MSHRIYTIHAIKTNKMVLPDFKVPSFFLLKFNNFHLVLITILNLFLFQLMTNFCKLPLRLCYKSCLILFFFCQLDIIILLGLAFILVINSNFFIIIIHYPEKKNCFSLFFLHFSNYTRLYHSYIILLNYLIFIFIIFIIHYRLRFSQLIIYFLTLNRIFLFQLRLFFYLIHFFRLQLFETFSFLIVLILMFNLVKNFCNTRFLFIMCQFTYLNLISYLLILLKTYANFCFHL